MAAHAGSTPFEMGLQVASGLECFIAVATRDGRLDVRRLHVVHHGGLTLGVGHLLAGPALQLGALHRLNLLDVGLNLPLVLRVWQIVSLKKN